MPDSIEMLVNEVRDDPLGRGYAAMDDDQLLASLNAQDRTQRVPITVADLLAWSAQGADDGATPPVPTRIERVEQASMGAAPFDLLPPSIKGIAKAAYVLITSGRDGTLDTTRHGGMITALVAAGVLTAAEGGELSAMATITDSRAVEIKVVDPGEKLFIGHVRQARSLIGG